MYLRLCLLALTTTLTILVFITALLYSHQPHLLRAFHPHHPVNHSNSQAEHTSVSLPPSTDHSSGESGHKYSNHAIAGAPVMAVPSHVPDSPPGPEAVLVLATLASDDIDWVYEGLEDLLYDNGGHLETARYVVDSQDAPLHTPANKGNEAMVYLTYMIDNYFQLPPISIFMHGHPRAWHGNLLLDMSSSEMVRQLDLEKVRSQGYVNLRCHWDPGCPDHLHPFETEYFRNKSEELLIKSAWMAVFEVPEEAVPKTISQPCCSQFAVTNDRILAWPRSKYMHFRDWLLDANIPDYFSGRVFEYFWHYMLNNLNPIYCPDPRICYCDTYHVCFENPELYDIYIETRYDLTGCEQELANWLEWKGAPPAEGDEKPVVDQLRHQIRELRAEVEYFRKLAYETGSDPKRKAAAMRAAAADGIPQITQRSRHR